MSDDTLWNKIMCIKDDPESAILALTGYLDDIYNLTDQFFDMKIDKKTNKVIRVLKKDLEHSDKPVNFILELNEDAKRYEKIREKLQNNDFNLSLVEINQIGLAFNYMAILIEKQIKTSQQALKDIENKIEILLPQDIRSLNLFKEKDS